MRRRSPLIEPIPPFGAGAEQSAVRPVIDDVEAFLRRYVVFASEAQVVACSLFVVHTYMLEAAEMTPYLAVTSAEKQSGKSRLLEVLERLVRDPWKVVSPSPAVLYRVIDQLHPTLLLDEVDTIFSQRGTYEDIRAVLNAGFRRGSPIPRWDADKKTIDMFDPFGAKVLAGIGGLPDTVQDRSIPIRLKRRTDQESVARFRHKQAQTADPLRMRLQEWAGTHLGAVKAAEPHLPDELSDRQQDAWEILLAIADVTGGEWPGRARAAAIELAKSRVDGHASWGVRLLADLRRLYLKEGQRHLSSEECLRWLNNLDGAPWSTWNNGTPINSFRLNALLEPYEIRTRDVRVRSWPNALKGINRNDLEEAFRRWLPLHEDDTSTDTATSRQDSAQTECRDVAILTPAPAV
jgi:hypothetical protein